MGLIDEECGASFIWQQTVRRMRLPVPTYRSAERQMRRAQPGLINQTHRKIREVSADGAYDARYCHDALLRKKIRPLIPARSGAKYWPDKYHERNHAVANQRLSGSDDMWKKRVDYHRRSVSETAMFRIKTLLGGHLSQRDYEAQVGNGDGQRAEPKDVVGYATQCQDRIIGVAEGAILSANADLFHKAVRGDNYPYMGGLHSS